MKFQGPPQLVKKWYQKNPRRNDGTPKIDKGVRVRFELRGPARALFGFRGARKCFGVSPLMKDMNEAEAFRVPADPVDEVFL